MSLFVCVLSHFSCAVFSGEGNGTPLQYSYLENPMDKRAWWAAVHGVAKSQTRLSDFFTFMHWRRKWQPTPVLLPGESQGRGSLGCRLLGRTESDTTEATQQQQQYSLYTKTWIQRFHVHLIEMHKKQILREKTEYTWFEKKLTIYTFKQGNLQYLIRTNIVGL